MATLALTFGGLVALAGGAGLVGLVWSTALWWGRLWAGRPGVARAYQRGRGLDRPHNWLDNLDVLSAVLVLGLLLGGAWEFGRAYRVQSLLDEGCAQAAQYLTLHPEEAATPAGRDRAAAAIVRRVVAPDLGDELAGQVTVTTWSAPTEITVRVAAPWRPGLPLLPLLSAGQTIAVRRLAAQNQQR
jgi:hypothetical protein